LSERTSHDELDTKIVRSSAWGAVGYGGLHVLSLVTTIVLARLLVPSDFGLIALAITLLAVAHLAQESGLGAALVVQKGDLRKAAGSVLVFSPLVGLGLFTAVFFLAPVLADLFDTPRLTNVLRVTALVVPIRGLSVVPQALLQRSMLFVPIAVMEIGGGLAQTVTAIGLGLAGAGVWSLVVAQIAACVAQLAISWWYTPFRPSPRDADWRTLRTMARFGRHVGVANILNLGNSTAEGVVIGRLLGTKPLGFYSVANRLAQMPVSVVSNILGRGVYAAMAQVNDDIPAVRRIWLTNLQRVALLSVPTSIGLVFTSRPLVDVMLGSEWEPAVIPLQVLTLNGLVRTFTATSGEVFQALHRAHYRVYVEVLRLLVVVPSLVVGAKVHGITGVAFAAVAVSVVTGLPALAAVMWLVKASVGEVLAAIGRPAIGWGLMGASLALATPVVEDLPSAVTLTALIVVGSTLYAAAIALFARDVVRSMWLSLRGSSASA